MPSVKVLFEKTLRVVKIKGRNAKQGRELPPHSEKRTVMGVGKENDGKLSGESLILHLS